MNTTTALVTGANKGIGKEIARRLVADGWTVHVGSRDVERARTAVDEIGGGAVPLQLDVTDPGSVADAARVVTNAFLPAFGARHIRASSTSPAGPDR
ncbi:SDR family oxidoreductase [Prauserella halophila]|uniref:SDR family oxidoreductase n=1 Tax=Prauserella halophila TaxID=185641 RepID=UPI0027E2C8EE|nr:SDR family NAD(P)-dependent oxidoreductase [Prauserella halophila]